MILVLVAVIGMMVVSAVVGVVVWLMVRDSADTTTTGMTVVRKSIPTTAVNIPTTAVNIPTTPMNLQGGNKLLTSDMYYELIGTRQPASDLYRYDTFARALQEFPKFNLSDNATVARRELACLFTHIKHEVSFIYTEQLCDAGGFQGACRAAMGDKSMGFGRGVIQLTHEPNYRKFSNDVFGDDRVVRDPDMILRDPVLFWGTGFWFYRDRLQQHMQEDPPYFAMTMWKVCCICVLRHNGGPIRGETYKSYCRILGVDPGPDDRVYARGPLTADPC